MKLRRESMLCHVPRIREPITDHRVVLTKDLEESSSDVKNDDGLSGPRTYLCARGSRVKMMCLRTTDSVRE
jgi:hypothetical protein